ESKLKFYLGLGDIPVEATTRLPFREDSLEPRLMPDGFEAFIEDAFDFCGLPSPAYIDCSEAPCMAFVWWSREQALASVYNSNLSIMECPELFEPFQAVGVASTGDMWIECPEGARQVSWAIPGNAYELSA